MRRFVGLAAAIIAAMALGQLITDNIPLGEAATAPFVHEARVGDTVELRYADVTVNGIRSAKKIDGADVAVAGGTFLIVDLELRGKLEPSLMQGFYIIDRKNRRFDLTTLGSNCALNTTPPTGARWHMMVCFDLPRDALEGAVLSFSKGAYEVNGSGQRRDDLALIDLGISKQEADELWASQDSYKTDRPGFQPLDKTTVAIK